MAYRKDFTPPAELLEQVNTQSFDMFVAGTDPGLLKAVMQAGRQQYLKIEPYIIDKSV